MTKQYRNPPLIEAACEFSYRLGELWVEAIRDRYYDAIKERYPNKGRSVRQNLEAAPLIDEQGVGQSLNLSATEVSVFADADRRAFIQLTPDTLTINVTTPYPSWKGVRPRIGEALAALTHVVGIDALTSARLIYIDRIILPEGAQIDRFLTFRPCLAPAFPWQSADLYLGLHATDPDGSTYTIELRREVPGQGDGEIFLLRSEYAVERDQSMTEGLVWIETAHERIDELFEACLTDELRKLFDGGEVT